MSRSRFPLILLKAESRACIRNRPDLMNAGTRAVRTKALVAAFIRSVSEVMIRKLQSNSGTTILEFLHPLGSPVLNRSTRRRTDGPCQT